MRRVNLYVDRPSSIELQVRETVWIDRLTPTADGYVAEQHGALLAPGVTQLQLEAGLYYFRILDDAQLRVLAGSVQVTNPNHKVKYPEEGGHGLCGHVPALRVAYAPAGAR